MLGWQQTALLERIRQLRYILPPLLALLVIGYQLGVARTLESNYGHVIHYGVEIAFYSLAGPVVTWLTLAWVERRLIEKESLERQVRVRDQQLARLTAVSADAIISLDRTGHILSWNRGAERIFGYASGAIIGQSLSKLLPESEPLVDLLQQDNLIQNFEATAVTRTGRGVAVDVTRTLAPEVGSEATASLLIMRDVTPRRERAAILEEERSRIARNLHDGVAQTLYFLALKADLVAEQIEDTPDRVVPHLREIGQQARQAIREVRRTIFALRPLDWSKEGFVPALRRFARDFAEQANWQITTKIEETIAIPPRLEPTIFRLTQESLNNVAKHAQAGQVWLELYPTDPAHLIVRVRDDGCGFEPTTLSRRGLGLGQMRQRVEALGGTFSLESQPEAGTTVTARLPL